MKHKIFYGWINAFICFLIVFFGTGVAAATFNIFTIPVTEYYGISRTFYSLATSVSTILSAIMYFIYGSLVKKIGLKKSILIAFFMKFVSYALFSSGLGIWTIFVKDIINGLFSVFISASILTQIINHWFNEKRGFLIGIINSASALGGAVFSPTLGDIIEQFSWQYACGLITLCIFLCIPIVMKFLIVTPEEIGLHPYGENTSVSSTNTITGYSLSEIYHDWRFILLMIICFMAYFAGTPAYNIITPHLIDSGFELAFVSGVVMVIALIINALSKIIVGMINDKFGLLIALVFTCLFAISGAFMIANVQNSSSFYAIMSVVLVTVGVTLPIVGVPLLVQRIFGSKEFSHVIGYALAAGYAGTTLGIPLANNIYDNFGSYTYAYLIFAFVSIVSLLSIFIILNCKKTKTNLF